MLRTAMLRCWVYGVEQGHVRTPTDIPQLPKNANNLYSSSPAPIISTRSLICTWAHPFLLFFLLLLRLLPIPLLY